VIFALSGIALGCWAGAGEPDALTDTAAEPLNPVLSVDFDQIVARRVRLQRSPDADTLIANSAGTPGLDCGPLASSAWSTVAVTRGSTESTCGSL